MSVVPFLTFTWSCEAVAVVVEPAGLTSTVNPVSDDVLWASPR